MSIGTFGDTYIDELLAEYVPPEETLADDMLADEGKQLLYALLLEMRARRIETGNYDLDTTLEKQRTAVEQGTPDTEGSYLSKDYDVTPLDDSDDWRKIDLDFVTSEVDLRFDAPVHVAFTTPSDQSAVVSYTAEESPVVGVPVSTPAIWITAQEGTGGATVTLEAWS